MDNYILCSININQIFKNHRKINNVLFYTTGIDHAILLLIIVALRQIHATFARKLCHSPTKNYFFSIYVLVCNFYLDILFH